MPELSQSAQQNSTKHAANPILSGANANSELNADVHHVTISLLRDKEIDHCPFWLAFYKSGPLKPHELLEQSPNLELALKKAAEVGITETGTFMLNDTTLAHKSRNIYFLPQDRITLMSNNKPAEELASALAAYGMSRLGIFIPPSFTAKRTSLSILEGVCMHLILASKVREIFFCAGTFGLNAALNAALRVRDGLLAQKKNVSVFVIH